LFQLLNLGGYFEPPYPSESTPLSLVDDGIRWSSPLCFGPATYNLTKFLWINETRGLYGPVASDGQQANLSSGSSITIVKTITQASDLSYWINLTIYDSTGDGKPGSGDYILLTGPPHKSDIVYTIALAYVANGSACAEYSYAIHNGKFYSWSSDTARTFVPWWYRL
ncbi:MAG: hypothetical protein WBC49_03455, partial [Thermoplasmata archaeon]